jgi:ribonuclease P protein component
LTFPPPDPIRRWIGGRPFAGGLFYCFFEFEGMSDEAHFPAEQPRPRAPSRLPLADVDGGRTGRDPGAARARSPQAVGLNDRAATSQSTGANRDPAGDLRTLTRRADFIAANTGRRAPMPGFVLIVRHRGDADSAARIGYTVTKKIGNAVVRNRMKRRLRALARDILASRAIPGADHVLIGRAGGIERDYATLGAELVKAIAKAGR